jgi:formylglycine-generating enzyme required for sulfatase activity
MIRIPGGTFRMGSDRHYPDEAPSHAVTVDGFWIDPTPVTNAQFRAFVQATNYVTWAEIAPDPKGRRGSRPDRQGDRRRRVCGGSDVFYPGEKAVN